MPASRPTIHTAGAGARMPCGRPRRRLHCDCKYPDRFRNGHAMRASENPPEATAFRRSPDVMRNLKAEGRKCPKKSRSNGRLRLQCAPDDWQPGQSCRNATRCCGCGDTSWPRREASFLRKGRVCESGATSNGCARCPNPNFGTSDCSTCRAAISAGFRRICGRDSPPARRTAGMACARTPAISPQMVARGTSNGLAPSRRSSSSATGSAMRSHHDVRSRRIGCGSSGGMRPVIVFGKVDLAAPVRPGDRCERSRPGRIPT